MKNVNNGIVVTEVKYILGVKGLTTVKRSSSTTAVTNLSMDYVPSEIYVKGFLTNQCLSPFSFRMVSSVPFRVHSCCIILMEVSGRVIEQNINPATARSTLVESHHPNNVLVEDHVDAIPSLAVKMLNNKASKTACPVR